MASTAGGAAEQPRLHIALGAPLTGEDEPVPVVVTVETPQGHTRTPSDICCVIDVSGSMGNEATIQSAGGGTESHGLTLLDVAKHGVRTVMKTLGKDDRLSVVKFEERATTVFELLPMDEAGQEKAAALIDGLREGGGTHIWNGLHCGLEVLRTGAAPGRLSHVMLLTDGQTEDRAATLPSLRSYRASLERLPGTISTFGFGYNIDSELLVLLAKEGDGTYSFIPDAGFVGTVFVNTLSNLLVTMAREVYLDLDAEEGSSIERVKGETRSTRTGSQWRVSLGTLQYGQTKDTVLEMKVKPLPGEAFLVASLSFESAASGVERVGPFEALPNLPVDVDEVEPQVLRSTFVELVTKGVELGKDEGSRPKALESITGLAGRIAASKAAEHPFLKALLEDVKGQTTEALSRRDWFDKWGVHYLPSIAFAHQVQQCNNFKDPSVQLYGGKLFQSIQETADSIFNSLPAPTPTGSSFDYGYGGHGASAAPAAPQLVSMAAYNDRYGVCIDAASPVRLASGEVRCVGELKKGDRVEAFRDGGAVQSEVLCLVRTKCLDSRALLCRLPGGARVTPYHPIHVNGEWRFPVEVVEPEELPCEAVCSLVLQGAHGAVVAGTPCAALGHGIEEGAARHPYFGSQRVLEDLARAPGFFDGLVELDAGSSVLRDPETGMVSGLRFGGA